MALPSMGYDPNQQKKNVIENKKRKASKGSPKGNGQQWKITPSSDASSLAEMIERQAVDQKAQANAMPGGGAPNPVQGLMDQFTSQYNSINVPSTPFEELQRLASSQVNAQFDPMMQMLQQQMDSTTKKGKANQGEARDMYGALSRDFLSQIPEMTQQFAAQDQETNSRYDNAQAELEKMYGQQANQQQAILQQLGITAAAPDASQQARDDQSYFQGQMELEQQSAMDQLNSQQGAAQNYQQNLGDTTRIAGENAAQDIGRMLQEYLGQANTQMGGLQSQKSTALGSLLSQMQAQDADRVAKEEQQQFDNLLAMSRFQMDAAGQMADSENNVAGLFGDVTTGLQGAQTFLAEKYPGQDLLASNLMQQINDVLANEDVVRGKFQLDPGTKDGRKGPTYSDVGQEKMLDLLRAEFERENAQQPGRYGTADINTTLNAMLAYLGKLR